MKYTALIFVGALSWSCQSVKKNILPAQTQEPRILAHGQVIESAFDKLLEGQVEAAWKDFQELKKQGLSLEEVAYIQMGEARGYHLLGEVPAAMKIYQDLLSRDNSLPHDMRKTLRFYLAEGFEDLGDLNRYLSTLTELEGFELNLDEQFLLGVKKGIAYSKVQMSQNLKALTKKLNQLDQQLALEIKEPEALGRLYFEASLFSTQTLHESAFDLHLKIQEWTQPWRAKAIATGDHKWSDLAVHRTQQEWKLLWDLALNPQLPKAMDPRIRQAQMDEISRKRLGQLEDQLQKFEIQFLLPFPNPERNHETHLGLFIDSVKQNIQHEIMRLNEKMKPERVGPIPQAPGVPVLPKDPWEDSYELPGDGSGSL